MGGLSYSIIRGDCREKGHSILDCRGELFRAMQGEPWTGGFVDVLGKQIEDGA